VELLLSHFSGLAHLHKFTLEEGNLPGVALSIFLSSRQHRGILHLHDWVDSICDTGMSAPP
jgi:hypothetical protein